jgi:lipoprotein-anchoring transpeptidase ErfK/SrfK
LSVDGIVGPRTLAALESPAAPQLRGGPDTRIEVDLTRQLAHVVRDGTRVVTLHISSGNGEAYRGGTAYGRTPVGDFRVERRIHGERHAELGILYDPLYFHRGYAIHGSNSVPNHPASHGCVRVTRADARWLIANIADGTPVQLHGGTHVFTPSR